MYEEITSKIDSLIDEFKKQPEYVEYMNLKESLSSTYKNEFKLLDSAKNEFEEVLKYSKHHPDYNEKKNTYNKIKNELFSNPDIQRYKELEFELQDTLDEISKGIAKAISPNVKYISGIL